MKTSSLNIKIASKLCFLVGVSFLIVSCSAPRLFQFQDISFFTSSSSQAQLGNLGIMTAENGFGFQRVAFLSDCQNHSLPASIDATIHGILPLQNAFGPGTRAKQLSVILGVPKESLAKASVFLFAINPLDAQQSAETWPSGCKTLVGRDSEQTRIIISVAALVPHHVLSPKMASNRLTAQISPRGHISLTVHAKKKREINVAPQSIFAWRSGHFCWPSDQSNSPIVRSDDPGFDSCPEGYDTIVPEGSPWAVPNQDNVDSETETDVQPEPEEEAPSSEPVPGETGASAQTTPSL